MKPIQALVLVPLFLSLPACIATRIVTVPVGLAVDVVEVTGKSVVYVGGTAVRTTGDVLDGPDEKAKLHVTLHIRKTVKVKYLERELKKIEKKGRIVDVEVTTAD